MQTARLSAPAEVSGVRRAGSSGHPAATRVLMKLPQVPSVGRVELVVKQMPRHWMLRGRISPGTSTVMRGSQGEPSGRRVMSADVVPQAPVRALRRRRPRCSRAASQG